MKNKWECFGHVRVGSGGQGRTIEELVGSRLSWDDSWWVGRLYIKLKWRLMVTFNRLIENLMTVPHTTCSDARILYDNLKMITYKCDNNVSQNFKKEQNWKEFLSFYLSCPLFFFPCLTTFFLILMFLSAIVKSKYNYLKPLLTQIWH